MDPLRLMMRLSRLARHPPGKRQLLLIAIVLAVAFAIWGAERAGLLPQIEMNRLRPPRL